MDDAAISPYKQTYLNYNERKAVRSVVEMIPARFPSVRKIVLYGSKARGDFREDSDLDLLFVTEGVVPRSVKFGIYDLIYELELENDVVISAVFFCEEDLAAQRVPLSRSIREEGIDLWLRE